MKPVRTARRIATGTRRPAATRDSRKLPARRSSSGNSHLCGGSYAIALVCDHVADRIVDRVLCRPAGRRAESSGFRAAVRDLFEARLVGNLERDEAELGARAGALEDALGQVEDRDLLGRPDVEYFAERRLAFEQREQRADGVVDVQEAARLRAVAVDSERLACQRLADEARHHHAVLAGLARTDGVEQADDDVLSAQLPVVAECEDLA